MFDEVAVSQGYRLADYRLRSELENEVRDLEARAGPHVARLRGRKVWMVNSAAAGGGVAEMMPRLVSLLRQLGVDARWLVLRADDPGFFALTKRLHNMLHGAPGPALGADDAARYAALSRRAAEALAPRLAPCDLLVIHDPQPLGLGAELKRGLGLPLVWRCHIGLDRETPETRAAWEFLAPYARRCDRAIFSLSSYAPDFLADRAGVIAPSIDPLSHKNRALAVPKLTGILVAARLAASPHPPIVEPFEAPVCRLQPGGWEPVRGEADFGLLFRPIVLQVSRWDRLKGFAPLLEGFCRAKSQVSESVGRHQRLLSLAGLVLAGPDPTGVADDPEAAEVLAELAARWRGLPPALQAEVALLRLPMASNKQNALVVNALQRCAMIAVQNSRREAFGLTATEAMWKGLPVLAASAAGLRAQIRDGVEGRIVRDPDDPDEIARRLVEMLQDVKRTEVWGRNAHVRVQREYLIFGQVARWLEELAALA